MRLNLLLLQIANAETLPKGWMQGETFLSTSRSREKIVDEKYQKVKAWRYACASCGCAFRFYPQGVGRQHIFHRVIGRAVMPHVLGLSYGAAAIVLADWGLA